MRFLNSPPMLWRQIPGCSICCAEHPLYNILCDSRARILQDRMKQLAAVSHCKICHLKQRFFCRGPSKTARARYPESSGGTVQAMAKRSYAALQALQGERTGIAPGPPSPSGASPTFLKTNSVHPFPPFSFSKNACCTRPRLTLDVTPCRFLAKLP